MTVHFVLKFRTGMWVSDDMKTDILYYSDLLNEI